MIGWYPQLLTNFATRSVAGASLDFTLFNLLGFTCYAVYNAALYASPLVRAQYAASHGGLAPDVRSNDVFFAAHALLLHALAMRKAAHAGIGKPAAAAQFGQGFQGHGSGSHGHDC